MLHTSNIDIYSRTIEETGVVARQDQSCFPSCLLLFMFRESTTHSSDESLSSYIYMHKVCVCIKEKINLVWHLPPEDSKRERERFGALKERIAGKSGKKHCSLRRQKALVQMTCHVLNVNKVIYRQKLTQIVNLNHVLLFFFTFSIIEKQ